MAKAKGKEPEKLKQSQSHQQSQSQAQQNQYAANKLLNKAIENRLVLSVTTRQGKVIECHFLGITRYEYTVLNIETGKIQIIHKHAVDYIDFPKGII